VHEFFNEQENSLRRFLINHLIKQSTNADKRDTVERTHPLINPSASVGDVQLARRFSK
jgi:hypothetical protein